MGDSVETQKFPGREPQNQSEGILPANTVLQNRYRITGVLGVGGMGAVYQARDLHFPNVKRTVAVKEMLNTSQDPQIREITLRHFEREADILASLDHPTVPKIYDYFSVRNRAYLVMEYINGRDLEEIINKANDFLKADVVYQWAIDLCDVLHYLHSHQPQTIVFRDVKPSNIMIDQHHNVRLIDFGIARAFQVGEKGTMIGTEGYSPPEQYRGEASPKGDIYALGATLHHILTRRDPRLEPPFSFADRPIRDYNPNVSAEFEAVINRSLAYSSDDRYPTAADMKAALEQIRAMPGSTGAPIQAAAPVAASEAPAAEAAKKPPTGFFPTTGEVIPLWKFQCEDEVRSSPVVDKETLYVGCHDNGLYALNITDGSFRWRYATEGGISSTPALHDNSVFIGSDDYRLYAIDNTTGHFQWMFSTEGPVRSSPRVALGHIFVGSDDGFVYAVKVLGGRLAWKFDAAAPVRSTAWVSDERVFFGSESGEFHAVDLAGTVKWRFKARRGIMSSPVAHEDRIYFGSIDWHIYALELDTGWTAWRYRTGKHIVSSPVLDDKNLYVGCGDGMLYAVDYRTGRDRWKFQTEGQIASSPALYQGAVYFGSTDGYVYSVETKSGQLRWKFQTGDQVISSPFIKDGVVYIGSLDHYVYALTP
jgi:outer membrane protein assembly factor BamB/tRNA A-37 threonylcarbamoyl transferase component Bud32